MKKALSMRESLALSDFEILKARLAILKYSLEGSSMAKKRLEESSNRATNLIAALWATEPDGITEQVYKSLNPTESGGRGWAALAMVNRGTSLDPILRQEGVEGPGGLRGLLLSVLQASLPPGSLLDSLMSSVDAWPTGEVPQSEVDEMWRISERDIDRSEAECAFVETILTGLYESLPHHMRAFPCVLQVHELLGRLLHRDVDQLDLASFESFVSSLLPGGRMTPHSGLDWSQCRRLFEAYSIEGRITSVRSFLKKIFPESTVTLKALPSLNGLKKKKKRSDMLRASLWNARGLVGWLSDPIHGPDNAIWCFEQASTFSGGADWLDHNISCARMATLCSDTADELAKAFTKANSLQKEVMGRLEAMRAHSSGGPELEMGKEGIVGLLLGYESQYGVESCLFRGSLGCMNRGFDPEQFGAKLSALGLDGISKELLPALLWQHKVSMPLLSLDHGILEEKLAQRGIKTSTKLGPVGPLEFLTTELAGCDLELSKATVELLRLTNKLGLLPSEEHFRGSLFSSVARTITNLPTRPYMTLRTFHSKP